MLSAALYNIRSLYNVGSVFRTGSGAGFEHIYLAGYTGSPPHPRIAKVALGAENEIPFSCHRNLDELLIALQDHFVIALELHETAVPYYQIDPPSGKNVTVVLGEEIAGVNSQLLERADVVAQLPMAGKKESLNVASAFAVVAYDLAFKLGRI